MSTASWIPQIPVGSTGFARSLSQYLAAVAASTGDISPTPLSVLDLAITAAQFSSNHSAPFAQPLSQTLPSPAPSVPFQNQQQTPMYLRQNPSSQTNTTIPFFTSPLSGANLSNRNLYQVFQLTPESMPLLVRNSVALANNTTSSNSNQAASLNKALKKHIPTHTSKKPYVCRWVGCGCRFADVSNVKRHEMSHLGLKPFLCSMKGCGGAFTRRSALKTHMLSKHKLKRDDPLFLAALYRKITTDNVAQTAPNMLDLRLPLRR